MSNTIVERERVTIDGSVYVIKPAGANRYAVFNDFGERCGYFMTGGKLVTADDYRVSGAHPVVQIGRLWRNAAEGAEQKPVASKMVCEVCTLPALGEADLDAARAHRRWLKQQPGLKAVFYAHDAASGKAMSIRVWANRGQMEANRGRTPPDGVKEPASSSVDVLSLVEDL